MSKASNNWLIQARKFGELAPFMSMMLRAREAEMSFEYQFKMRHQNFQSAVKVEIWLQDGRAVVMFTDINKGISITNSAEVVIEGVYHRYLSGLRKADCLFMETYDKHKDGIDLIIPHWCGEKVADVDWLHIGKIVN